MTLTYNDPCPDTLLENADRALYCSKHEGRNRVTHFDSLPEVQVEAKTCPLGPESTISTPTLPHSAVTALMKTLAYREPGTAIHSVRVANLCVRTAKRVLPAAEVHVFEAAALLHDIGKIGIPDSILLKPDRLTVAEWEIMDEHSHYSREILRAAFGSADVIRVVEWQHAFFGKSRKGLPTGRAIPLGSRMLSICDAYDTMINDQVYRKACSHADALAELRRCPPEQFDPEIAEVFAQCVREVQAIPDESEHGDLTRLHQSLDQESLQWLDLQEQAHEIVEHCRAAQDTLLTHDFCHRVERSLQQLIHPNSGEV